MEDRLARPGTRVEHGAVALRLETPRTCQLCSYHEQAPEKWSIVRGGIFQRGEMFAWNDKRVDGRLRVGVLKGHDLIVLEDNPGGYASLDDSAEDALVHVS